MGDIEETALGRDIDCAALRLGFAHLRAHPNLRLSINVSARSLGDGAWRQTLEDGLRDSGDAARRLILEMSETSAMFLPELVIRFMAEMQPKGIAFALDDFGGGMIAFRYLKDFLFDLVKIDRHFVHQIDRSPDNQVIAEALITVAHQFDMVCVAEGIETTEEARILNALGCDCLQGYHIGVPRMRI